VAAPIFRRVARRWAGTFPSVVDRITEKRGRRTARANLPLDSLRRRPALPADSVTTLPDLTGTSTRHALYWLREHGIDARLYGQGVVTKQKPKPGAQKPSRVLLESGA